MSFIEKFLPLDLHKIAIQESFLLEIEEPAWYIQDDERKMLTYGEESFMLVIQSRDRR